MKKYLRFLTTYLSQEFAYRESAIASVLYELIGIGSIVVVWIKLLQNNTVNLGYSLNDILSYYLLLPLIGFLTSAEILDKLGEEIKDGFFSVYLIRPYSLWISLVMQTLAEKIFYLFFIIPLYLLVIAFFVHLASLQFTQLPMFFVMILGGLSIHVALDICFAFFAFWIDDVWSFKHFKNVLIGIFAGLTFPFPLLPNPLQTFFTILPFRYLYYTPLTYLQQRQTLQTFVSDLIGVCVWLFIFSLFAQYLWRKGLKRYDAYGR